MEVNKQHLNALAHYVIDASLPPGLLGQTTVSLARDQSGRVDALLVPYRAPWAAWSWRSSDLDWQNCKDHLDQGMLPQVLEESFVELASARIGGSALLRPDLQGIAVVRRTLACPIVRAIMEGRGIDDAKSIARMWIGRQLGRRCRMLLSANGCR
ncbi:MAG: hypothetical protein O9327_02195 [Polaromonas sp.]|nr:hypothetical protein [Polaromonas sp.]